MISSKTKLPWYPRKFSIKAKHPVFCYHCVGGVEVQRGAGPSRRRLACQGQWAEAREAQTVRVHPSGFLLAMSTLSGVHRTTVSRTSESMHIEASLVIAHFMH
jgi:hypothetical protein